jgi:hypothetical protein
MQTESDRIRPPYTPAFPLSVRRALILLAVWPLLMLEPAVSNQQPAETPPQFNGGTVPSPSEYAGTAACAECHQKQATTYATTPHALDSSLPDAKTMLGGFTPDQGVLRTKDPNLVFVMTATPDGFYQTAVNISDPQHLTRDSRRVDIVVGSGRHGQTYLYWQGDLLYELPVSYWTYGHEWVNSPGYPDGQVHWDRPVGPRCLECHASYFQWLPTPVNRYAKNSVQLSIGCERCHGPGAKHVALERSATPPHSGSRDLGIVNPARLTRDQQISLCSLCHAGGGAPIKTPMSFVAGDDIHEYLKIVPPPSDAPVDVHGNQVGALEQSKCYRSGKLTCSTCHDVHETQENADAFSVHCLQCHQVKACPRYRTMGERIRGKCIECHMPEGTSNSIKTANSGHQMQATMRTHRIAIYPEAKLDAAGAPH